MSELRVVTEPLGGSPLAAAAIAGTAPAAWYPPRPSSRDAWSARVEIVRQMDAGWLDRLRPAFGGATAIARLERAAAAGGVVVTTGQQPGLFGGPVYTWSKAVSALALADAIERATGVPAAPVFWAATDDADFAEASVTHVAIGGGVETLRMPAATRDGVPMANVRLGDLRPLVERLRHGAGSVAFPDALAVVDRAYGEPSATVGSAYVELLRLLLEPLGVAVLDASHAAVRAAGASLVLRALAEAPAVAAALDERARALASRGFAPQVAVVPGLSLVFRAAGDGTKQRVSLLDAARHGTAPDDTLSPNVLLRPVMERAILPTAAYVAGPGEIAYFAQVSAVAAALGASAPLAVPRWSGTIVEPHVQRLLARLEVDPAALRDPHAAETRLARAAMPAELRDALVEARATAERAVDRVRRAAGGDAVGEPALHGAARALAARVDRLERRYVGAFKRREAATMRDLSTVRGALWPLGKRQERVLNFIPLLARHGPPLVQQMRACADSAIAALLTGAPSGR